MAGVAANSIFQALEVKMLRILFSYFTLDVLLHVVSAMDMSKSKYVDENRDVVWKKLWG